MEADARTHPGVTFIEGDCRAIAESFPPELLARLAHPWVIIEDAHVNVVGVLGHFHGHGLGPGDYLVVEDTNPEGPATLQAALGEASEYRPFGRAKLDELAAFLSVHGESYRVDTRYCDFFGYNATWN